MPDNPSPNPPINPIPQHPTPPSSTPQPFTPGGGTIYPGPSSIPQTPNYPRPERIEGPGGPERRP